MATQVLLWDDSSGDSIHIVYDEPSGDQSVSISSDPNSDITKERSKTINITAGQGIYAVTRQIEVRQRAAYAFGLIIDFVFSDSGQVLKADGSNYAYAVFYVQKTYLGVEISRTLVDPSSFILETISANGCILSATKTAFGTVQITAQNRENNTGLAGEFNISGSYMDYQANSRIIQEANQVVQTNEVIKCLIQTNDSTTISAAGGTMQIVISLYKEITQVLASGSSLPTTTEYLQETPNVSSNRSWCTVSGNTITIEGRGLEESEEERIASLTASYEGAQNGILILTQQCNVIESITLIPGLDPSVNGFESSNMGETVDSALSAAGDSTIVTLHLITSFIAYFSSGANETRINGIIPQKFLTYSISDTEHFSLNAINREITCYDREVNEGPLLQTEVVVNYGSYQYSGNYIYQEANIKMLQNEISQEKDAQISLTYGDDSYGSEVYPFAAGVLVQGELHNIIVTINIVTSFIRNYYYTSGAIQNAVIDRLTAPLDDIANIVCQGDGFYLWDKISDEDNGQFGFRFHSRNITEGEKRPGTIQVWIDEQQLPTTYNVYQEANVKSEVQQTRLNAHNFNITAVNTNTGVTAQPETSIDENGKICHTIYAAASGREFGLRVSFDEIKQYQFTSGEYTQEIIKTIVFNGPTLYVAGNGYDPETNETLPEATQRKYFEVVKVLNSTFQDYVIAPDPANEDELYQYFLDTPDQCQAYKRFTIPSLLDTLTEAGEMIVIPCFELSNMPDLSIYDRYESYIKVVRAANVLESEEHILDTVYLNGQAATTLTVSANTESVEISTNARAVKTYSSIHQKIVAGTPGITVSGTGNSYSDGIIHLAKNTSYDSTRQNAVTVTYEDRTINVLIIQQAKESVYTYELSGSVDYGDYDRIPASGGHAVLSVNLITYKNGVQQSSIPVNVTTMLIPSREGLYSIVKTGTGSYRVTGGSLGTDDWGYVSVYCYYTPEGSTEISADFGIYHDHNEVVSSVQSGVPIFGTLSASKNTMSAGGDSVTLSCQCQVKYIKTYASGSQVEEYESVDPEFVCSGSDFSVSGNTLTCNNRQDNVGAAIAGNVVASYAGSSSSPITITQEANQIVDTDITYGSESIEIVTDYNNSSSPCPASGGSWNVSTIYSRAVYTAYTFTSGYSRTDTSYETTPASLSYEVSGSGLSISGNTVTWTGRGTSPGAQRSGLIIAKSGVNTVTKEIYQEANEATVVKTISTFEIEGDQNELYVIAAARIFEVVYEGTIVTTYTSGGVVTTHFDPNISTSVAWLVYSNGELSVLANETDEQRTGTITASYEGAQSRAITVIQASAQVYEPAITAMLHSLSGQVDELTGFITITQVVVKLTSSDSKAFTVGGTLNIGIGEAGYDPITGNDSESLPANGTAYMTYNFSTGNVVRDGSSAHIRIGLTAVDNVSHQYDLGETDLGLVEESL